MAVDVTEYGVVYGQDSTLALQSALDSGNDLIVSGDLRYGTVTADNPGTSIIKTRAGSLTGTELRLKRFSSIRSDDAGSPLAAASRVTVTPDAVVRNALLKNLSMGAKSLVFDNDGDTVADTLGMTVDGLRWANSGETYNLQGGCIGWAENLTIRNCVGVNMTGPTIAVCGCNNIIEYNQHTANPVNGLTGIHQGSSIRRSKPQPHKCLTGNIFRNNTVNGVLEESFSFDSYLNGPNSAVLCLARVSAKTFETVTLEYDYQDANNRLYGTPYTGLMACFLSGPMAGQSFNITNHAGDTITLGGNISTAEVGDWITVFVGFTDNEYHDNTVNDGQQTPFFLYGCSWRNSLHDNTINRSLSPFRIFSMLDGDTGYVDDDPAYPYFIPRRYAPSGDNIIRHNAVNSFIDREDNIFGMIYDIGCPGGSGSEVVPDPYPMIYSWRNQFDVNVAAADSGAPYRLRLVHVRGAIATGNVAPANDLLVDAEVSITEVAFHPRRIRGAHVHGATVKTR